jgi:hypothetical protein
MPSGLPPEASTYKKKMRKRYYSRQRVVPVLAASGPGSKRRCHSLGYGGCDGSGGMELKLFQQQGKQPLANDTLSRKNGAI